MTEKTKINKSTKTVRYNQSAIYPENLEILYTNSALISLNERDLTIDFGIRRPELCENPDDIPPTQIIKRILMSLQHAKVFSEKLNGLIEQYENEFGIIQTAPIKK